MKKKIISVALMFALLLSVVPMLNVDVASAKKMPAPKVTYTNTGLMKLQWKKVKKARYYKVFYKVGKYNKFRAIPFRYNMSKDFKTKKTHMYVSGLKYRTHYYLKIKAFKKGGKLIKTSKVVHVHKR